MRLEKDQQRGRAGQRSGMNSALRTHGRLGVFWQTQGSGKTYAMVFFAQKVLRKIPGNWTFVGVTDRNELDEEQQRKLERVLGKQYHLITREDRLDKIAMDIVQHFTGRGFKGKAMVVCIDKLTAVRMYDKVKAQWTKHEAELIAMLKKAIGEAVDFCRQRGVDVDAILQTKALERVKALQDAREAMLVSDDSKWQFLALAGRTTVVYRAILPDTTASQYAQHCALFMTLADMIRALLPPVDISGVMQQIEAVLDKSVGTSGYTIKEEAKPLDLSRIDFDALRKFFKNAHKRAEIERLRAAVRLCIEEWLDRLPPVYTPTIYQAKCDAVYQHVYDMYREGFS
jgi:type I site-specific restriction-modification system R (restriction) subunit